MAPAIDLKRKLAVRDALARALSDQLSVVEIIDLAKERGINTSGRKEELARRIANKVMNDLLGEAPPGER